MTSFVDRVVVHVAAGDGGNGCTSVMREKFRPLGGPDGGNGGRGGDIILVADPQVTTLLEYHHSPHRKATSGKAGQGGNKDGANGQDTTLRVPPGTVVSNEAGDVLADLVAPGSTFVLAQGGKGGLGNAALSSSKRRAPGFALLGEPGESLTAVLELKTVADVGLIGFPSAGKSSLIAAISAARPKIADYPFTTLVPNLGVVKVGDNIFTVADVPGLIPGASQGKGLGLEFLRHVERCAALVHVLDCATLEPGRDPLGDLDAIEHELAEYGAGLEDRPRIVVLNKVDVPEARELAEFVTPDLEARGFQVFAVSAATHEGLKPFLYAMSNIVTQAREAAAVPVYQRITIRPKAVDDDGFVVRREGDAFRVIGDKPERWVRQTDFNNSEAVGFLADRLAKLGVETELLRQGAVRGSEVIIGERDNSVVFDFDPSIQAGAELLMGRRGVDLRLDGYASRRAKEGDSPETELAAAYGALQPWRTDDDLDDDLEDDDDDEDDV